MHEEGGEHPRHRQGRPQLVVIHQQGYEGGQVRGNIGKAQQSVEKRKLDHLRHSRGERL